MYQNIKYISKYQKYIKNHLIVINFNVAFKILNLKILKYRIVPRFLIPVLFLGIYLPC